MMTQNRANAHDCDCVIIHHTTTMQADKPSLTAALQANDAEWKAAVLTLRCPR